MSRVVDAEVQLFADCSRELQREYPEYDSIWKGSPFEWIWSRPPRQKGAIGERLVSNYLDAKGFSVERSRDPEADRMVNGIRAEIKCSMLWEGGIYKFQQLRDQNYEFVICLGISPRDVHCWVLPKTVIMRKWESGEISSQHGGRAGKDTAWLTVSPAKVPEWLQAFGGKLSDAIPHVARITGRIPRP